MSFIGLSGYCGWVGLAQRNPTPAAPARSVMSGYALRANPTYRLVDTGDEFQAQ